MKRLIPRTLRGRFALRAALLTLAVALATGIAAGLFLRTQVRRAIEDGVADHLLALEAELDLASVPIGREHPPIVLPSPEQSVQVVTLDGRTVAASSELIAADALITVDDVSASEPTTMVMSLPDGHGGSVETLTMARIIEVDDERFVGIVGASLARLDTVTTQVLLATLLGAPLLAFLIGLSVWYAVMLAMRPVTEMAEEADRVGRAAGPPWRLDVRPETMELEHLARNLDDLLAALHAAFDRDRRFLDDASHELRTPIAVARAELELAQTAAIGIPDVEEALASSIEELNRLDRLANDLLLLARTRGPDRESFRDLDLAGLARRTAAAVLRGSPRTDVALTVHGNAVAFGDEQSLERALGNILSNALRHTATSVDVALEVDQGTASVRVVDDGPGFSEGLLETAFERFSRSPEQRSSGTGLGLAIAAAIVEAHEGTLLAANREAGGAAVTIRLPVGHARARSDMVDQRATPTDGDRSSIEASR